MFKYLLTLVLFFSTSSLCAKEILTIYTHAPFVGATFGPGVPLKEAFEKICQCEIEYVALDTVPLAVNRLNLEGDRTRADLIIGLENIGLDTSRVDKLVPYASHCLGFVYDSRTLPNPPQTLEELIISSHPIILQDPRMSVTGLGFLIWMKKIYGDQAVEKWKTLNSHVLTFTRGWTESFALFKRGAAPIVFSYSTDAVYNELAKGFPYIKAMYFPEGHLCSHRFAGRVKTTQHAKLADQFMDFLGSKEAQTLIATHEWIYPVVQECTPETWLKSQNYRPQPNWIAYTPEEIVNFKKEWIQEWIHGLVQ